MLFGEDQSSGVNLTVDRKHNIDFIAIESQGSISITLIHGIGEVMCLLTYACEILAYSLAQSTLFWSYLAALS